MEFYNQITSKFLKGESIYPDLRRIISFLLKLSISTYIYVYFFGEFDLFEISEYRKIFKFFLSGHFFIPFLIYTLTHLVFYFFSTLIFSLLTIYPVIKLNKKIIDYKLTNEDKVTGENIVKSVAKYAIKKDVSDDDLLRVYKDYRKKVLFSYNTEINEEIEKEINLQKKNIESNFNFAFLIMIASIIIFYNLMEFNVILLIIVEVLALAFSIFSIFTYRFLDILPTIVLKIPEILKEHGVMDENIDLKEK